MLEWVDKAAYATAVGWAKPYCVTVYVGNIHFADAVNSGDMVEVEAAVMYTGGSSMHIKTVVSSGDPRGGTPTMFPLSLCLSVRSTQSSTAFGPSQMSRTPSDFMIQGRERASMMQARARSLLWGV